MFYDGTHSNSQVSNECRFQEAYRPIMDIGTLSLITLFTIFSAENRGGKGEKEGEGRAERGRKEERQGGERGRGSKGEGG